MKKGGGKRKGSSFERVIAKDLSLWITGGGNNGIFWRTHSSGAMGTVGKRRFEYGDIMAIDDLGKPLTDNYNIECRHGKVLNIKDLIYHPKSSSILQLILEGRKNADSSNRRPLWIFKEQGKDVMVMMNYDRNEPFKSLWNGIDFVLAIDLLHDVFLMTYENWKEEFILVGKQKTITEGI